ncbi:hypothetical protein M427DRAFT_50552 [Gonapodya prolifera JEL478]|uniref:histidine kinase n=1 Tax=Gonapodya prolifera (strain JEL478) TaxID=1344416 RepID=A0A139AZS0_GONPJ|nr:hypothetical protein M427DRAFT_50552 [Gonapodya prolifera JEL478]|eukprot:KXS22207.1 hypothetical protein M427DRAFT_50552 [Gonapodya prolifera JEL478]
MDAGTHGAHSRTSSNQTSDPSSTVGEPGGAQSVIGALPPNYHALLSASAMIYGTPTYVEMRHNLREKYKDFRKPSWPVFDDNARSLLAQFETPLWVWDFNKVGMEWANAAGVRVWRKRDLQHFLATDYRTDLTDATQARLIQIEDALLRGEKLYEQWTFYPGNIEGKRMAVTIDCNVSGVFDTSGTLFFIIEGIERAASTVAYGTQSTPGESVPFPIQADTATAIDTDAANNNGGTKRSRGSESEVSDTTDKRGQAPPSDNEMSPMEKKRKVAITTQFENDAGHNETGGASPKHSSSEVVSIPPTTQSDIDGHRITRPINTSYSTFHATVAPNVLRSVESFRHAPYCVLVLSPEYRVLVEHSLTMALFGTKFDLWSAFVDQQDAERARRALSSPSLQNGVFVDEVRLRTVNGERWFRMDGKRMNDPVTGGVLVLVYLVDVSLQKELERQLNNAKEMAEAGNRAKSEFLANISHEIRTPLTGILGYALLLHETSLDEQQRELLRTIRTCGDDLHTILSDVLDWSKIEAGKLELDPRPFDLVDLVRGVMELLRVRARERDLTMSYTVRLKDGQEVVNVMQKGSGVCPRSNRNRGSASTVTPGSPSTSYALLPSAYSPTDVPTVVLGDEQRLRQVLINLTSNAIKFTAPGGCVDIMISSTEDISEHDRDSSWWLDSYLPDDDIMASRSAINDSESTQSFTTNVWTKSRVKRQRVTLAVKDTGIGIPASRMDRLFQSFSQVDASTSRKYGGTGLGLAISHRLVELMGGTISCTSEVDVGSTFQFEVQLGVLAATKAVVMSSQIEDGNGVAPPSSTVPENLPSSSVTVGRPTISADLSTEGQGSSRRKTGAGIPAEYAGLGKQISLRILVAEDNPVNQKLMIRLLDRLSFMADLAVNGTEAVQKAKQCALESNPYDLILMDLQMPETDGLSATRLIRANPLLTACQPVIVGVTANASVSDRDECLAAGMDGYITKPLKLEQLVDKIRICIERRTRT